MNLPQDFLVEMKDLLKDDFEKYLELLAQSPFRGISINRIKAEPEKLIPLLPFKTKKNPYYDDGYYICSNESGIGDLPLHHAGAFYVQEPSAASAVSLLNIQKGDKVLDLCAAPGGKSAQIASKLNGSGLLWSNETVKKRSKILLSNFERMGIANGVVSSCYPEILCEKLSGFFDSVLVDAPCSGEGMFRKNPDAALEWSKEHVAACAKRQLSILKSASKCVKAGGILVYSTCTFSKEENEDIVSKFLECCPEFEPYETNETIGRKTEYKNAVRITPIEGGEGHFAARFRKKDGYGNEKNIDAYTSKIKKDTQILIDKFLDDIFVVRPRLRYNVVGSKIYLLPDDMPFVDGAGVIRAGVFAGETARNRIEPAHALFMSSKPSSLRRVVYISSEDKRIDDFLKGLEIDCDCENGYAGVAYCGIIVGFGKCSNGRLKNKYPKGLRKNV